MISFTFMSCPGPLLYTFIFPKSFVASSVFSLFAYRPTGNAAHSLVRPRHQDRASSSGAFVCAILSVVEGASTQRKRHRGFSCRHLRYIAGTPLLLQLQD